MLLVTTLEKNNKITKKSNPTYIKIGISSNILVVPLKKRKIFVIIQNSWQKSSKTSRKTLNKLNLVSKNDKK